VLEDKAAKYEPDRLLPGCPESVDEDGMDEFTIVCRSAREPEHMDHSWRVKHVREIAERMCKFEEPEQELEDQKAKYRDDQLLRSCSEGRKKTDMRSLAHYCRWAHKPSEIKKNWRIRDIKKIWEHIWQDEYLLDDGK
jgi:hypothetical protein